MKQISLYAIGLLLGSSLIACDDYKEPNPPAQSNSPSSILQTSDITETKVVGDAVYDLHAMYAAEEVINIATIACDKLAEGYTFDGEGFISVDNFETSFPVPLYSQKSEDADVWTLYVEPLTLSNIYRENISRLNGEVAVQLRFNLTTVYQIEQGEQVAYVGGPGHYYGPYTLNINPIPEEKVYFDYLYTPGQYNSWNQAASQMLYTLVNGDLAYVEYKGFAVFSDSYKYTSQADWDGLNFGAGEEAGTLSTDPEAGNITVASEGLYYSQVHVDNLTYSNYLVNTIGVIGDATPGGWDTSTALTSDNYLIWSGEVYLVPGTYKFRCNDEWEVDLGGTPDHLEFGTNGGGNIEFSGTEGTYIVTLDLSKLPYTCTVVAK